MTFASSATRSIRSGMFAVAVTSVAWAGMATAGKDLGPVGTCDGAVKGSTTWRDCIGAATAKLSDEDLFYAGYWMARLGRYEEAIAYLKRTQSPDARSLTYLGFATRKSGDVAGAFPLYQAALARDPNYVVARAYLGEALLAVGNVSAAKAELTEIAQRCGATCAAYDELARHIARYAS